MDNLYDIQILLAGCCVGRGAVFRMPRHEDETDTVTVGMILPMTGQQASTGKQERAGAELYIQEHGDTGNSPVRSIASTSRTTPAGPRTPPSASRKELIGNHLAERAV